MCRDRDCKDARDGRAGDEQPQAVAGTVCQCASACGTREHAVGRGDSRETLILAAVHRQLRCATDCLDELCRQLAACPRLEPCGPPAEKSGDRGNSDPTEDQAGGQHDRGGRQEKSRHDDSDRAGARRDEHRPGAAQMEVLEGVDVGDEPRDEVAAAVAPELRRRKRLDTFVHVNTGPAENAKREVVRGDALGVTRDRPREPEEPDAHDRDGQREHFRAFRSTRDQVARSRHEPDAADHRCGSETDREGDARAWRSRNRE